MEPNNGDEDADSGLATAMRFRDDLISSGCPVERAIGVAQTLLYIHSGIADLTRFVGPSTESKLVAVPISAPVESSEQLAGENALLPWWEKLGSALTSVTPTDQGCVRLSFSNVRLGKDVMEVLLEAFQRAPLETLLLDNNGLGNGGMDLMISALKDNSTLKVVGIENNTFEPDPLLSLVGTVTNHPSITTFGLENCAIGRNNTAMEAIVPDLLGSLEEVHLKGNGIGVYGAELIANCLARNPALRYLDLDNNTLGDEGAKMIAQSLKSNTHLQRLRLAGNRTTHVGVRALMNAVLGTEWGLNALHNANHQCSILTEGDQLQIFNQYVEPEKNRKAKLVLAIYPGKNSYSHFRYLNDTPVEIMPRVLSFLQEEIVGARKLNSLFCLMREWNMPLLYTNNGNLRKSDRIRKKKVQTLCVEI